MATTLRTGVNRSSCSNCVEGPSRLMSFWLRRRRVWSDFLMSLILFVISWTNHFRCLSYTSHSGMSDGNVALSPVRPRKNESSRAARMRATPERPLLGHQNPPNQSDPKVGERVRHASGHGWMGMGSGGGIRVRCFGLEFQYWSLASGRFVCFGDEGRTRSNAPATLTTRFIVRALGR